MIEDSTRSRNKFELDGLSREGYRPRLAPQWWVWPLLVASLALNAVLIAIVSAALARI